MSLNLMQIHSPLYANSIKSKYFKIETTKSDRIEKQSGVVQKPEFCEYVRHRGFDVKNLRHLKS